MMELRRDGIGGAVCITKKRQRLQHRLDSSEPGAAAYPEDEDCSGLQH